MTTKIFLIDLKARKYLKRIDHVNTYEMITRIRMRTRISVTRRRTVHTLTFLLLKYFKLYEILINFTQNSLLLQYNTKLSLTWLADKSQEWSRREAEKGKERTIGSKILNNNTFDVKQKLLEIGKRETYAYIRKIQQELKF